MPKKATKKTGCAAKKAAISKAKSPRARGKALAAYNACRKAGGHKSSPARRKKASGPKAKPAKRSKGRRCVPTCQCRS